ncbi:hypothetical protein BFG57_15460 [Bacillus solimangrovi]|uniref:Uncharacterized protein n=2 Tax=Bacillus solimangrovi TaxID=1305675 RepID=A0A1E5LEP6_9BACI|nr:hypothetical protein BFG57_15460 [Bacillus solimangrovi]
MFEKVSPKRGAIHGIIVFTIVMSFNSFVQLYKPNNSLDLYQLIRFADDFEEAQSLMLDGYEDNFRKEDFEAIQNSFSTDRISQFTLIQYRNKSYLIETSPGTNRIQTLKILAVEELPTEIRDYFLEIRP